MPLHGRPALNHPTQYSSKSRPAPASSTQEIWHGSGSNPTGDQMRRSIGIHMVPDDARFSERPGGYIYRRYQWTDDPCLDESYFPLLWSGGKRTAWIDGYCETGRRRYPVHIAA